MAVQPKMPNDKLLQYIYAAAAEYKKIIGQSFLLAGKNRHTEYQWFECVFEKKHFMHLLGIKSKKYKADRFFDACDSYNKGEGKGITIQDCSPSRNHSRTTVNEKVSVCPEILQIQNAGYLKIGFKDKISLYVDFSYAYGSDVTLGFQENGNGLGYPVTLIPKNIHTFTTQSYKVLFVFKKGIGEKHYEELYVEGKKGLLKELYPDFPKTLKERICCHFF